MPKGSWLRRVPATCSAPASGAGCAPVRSHRAPFAQKTHGKEAWRAGFRRAQEALAAQNASYAHGGGPLSGTATLDAGRDAIVLDLGGLAERLWAVELAALHGAATHAVAEERRRCARPFPGSESWEMEWVLCVFHQACLILGMISG